MPLVLNRADLVREVKAGNVAAAAELARKAQARNVTELLALVSPRAHPSVALVDTCADAFALLKS